MFTRRFSQCGRELCVCVCWTLLTLELFAVNNINIRNRTPLVCSPVSPKHPSSGSGSSGIMISRNLKNVLVVSVGFLSLFTAFGGLQNLQVSKRHRLLSVISGDAPPPGPAAPRAGSRCPPASPFQVGTQLSPVC